MEALGVLFPKLLTVTTGLFAGFSLTVSYVASPGALYSSEPEKIWREMLFKRGHQVAIPLVFSSLLLSIGSFLVRGASLSEDFGLLIVGALMFSVSIFTRTVMADVNNKLGDLKAKRSDREGRELILKWIYFQYFRTAVGLTAFLLQTFGYAQN